jgi:hypothetical protein
MRSDAGASQAFRNDATAQKNPAFGGANRPLGVVATLARCSSIARRAAPSRMSRFAPIKLIPIYQEPL